MNKRKIVKIDGHFEAEALRVLRQVPGMTVLDRPEAATRADALVRFAGSRVPVAVEFRQRASAAAAWQLVEYSRENPRQHYMLVAEETTDEARRILEEHGIAVVDGLGNAHIELPGLLFHVEGQRRGKRSSAAAAARLAGKAGVAAQALLLDPQREWRVSDLAEQAGVSVGLAHRVLSRLQYEGVVESVGAGPNRVRRVANPRALLDLWAEENTDRPRRSRGFLLAQSPEQLLENLGAALTAAGIDYALTGSAGARLVGPLVTAVPVVSVWTREKEASDRLFDVVHGESTSEGHNVTFLQAKNDVALAFRHRVGELWVANRFRLYVDLREDPRRGWEQAENLREEVIGF